MKTGTGNFALIALLIISVLVPAAGAEDWQARLATELPVLGHRNWIVVADSAYPKQSAPGIETIDTGGGQIEVLSHVLAAVQKAPHVRAVVMMDAELASVSEEDAPGVTAYRESLKKVLDHNQVKVMPHEEIIGSLDESAKLFNILLLKTRMTIPYTSVFLQLDCAYWNADKEKRLRSALEQQK
ncbi:MAG: hypothetical protein OES79_08010 [Planctomycetota bacterium]|nr:hypothetical protein [Planctomycetota bacterium]